MDIKELYITDLNSDGEFWSKDKIDKLNDMFAQLKSGLHTGAEGSVGAGGAPGSDGLVGSQGTTGSAGSVGVIGNSGESIWSKTTSSAGLETLSLNSIDKGILLGATSSLVGSTCDTLTAIGTTAPVQGGVKPSALRIHAINDTGGSLRKHIRLKAYEYSTTTDSQGTIDFNPSNETTTFAADRIGIYSTNISINDGATVVAAFTDGGIVIKSDLTFKTSPATTQYFEGDVSLTGVAALYLANNPGLTVTGKHLTINTGLSEGNVEFTSIATSFTSFPRGAMLQVNQQTLNQYFNVKYQKTSSLDFLTGLGYEVYFGRGEGPWTGWYLVNGSTWQSPSGEVTTTVRIGQTDADGLQASLLMKRLNTQNTSVTDSNTYMIPSTLDENIYLPGGGVYSVSINSSTGSLGVSVGGSINSSTNIGGSEIFLADYYGSNDHVSLYLSSQSYAVYIGQPHWVWYTETPPGPGGLQVSL